MPAGTSTNPRGPCVARGGCQAASYTKSVGFCAKACIPSYATPRRLRPSSDLPALARHRCGDGRGGVARPPGRVRTRGRWRRGRGTPAALGPGHRHGGWGRVHRRRRAQCHPGPADPSLRIRVRLGRCVRARRQPGLDRDVTAPGRRRDHRLRPPDEATARSALPPSRGRRSGRSARFGRSRRPGRRGSVPTVAELRRARTALRGGGACSRCGPTATPPCSRDTVDTADTAETTETADEADAETEDETDGERVPEPVTQTLSPSPSH